MEIVEIGIKLNKNFDYYDKMLKNEGFVNDFKVITHDIYYANQDLTDLSEGQMKNACIRLRCCNDGNYIMQNNSGNKFEEKEIMVTKLNDFEKRLFDLGYKKVIDTSKKDFHYYKNGMSSKIQLQQIDNIGLLVYYDNKNYYQYELEIQRKKLIDELNLYGFNLSYNILGLDKLRTLYYGKEIYSKNQNG